MKSLPQISEAEFEVMKVILFLSVITMGILPLWFLLISKMINSPNQK